MVNILVDKDYFAYISCDDKSLFSLIKRSFTRKISKYNNWLKRYEEREVKHYTLFNKGKQIKVKAGLIPFLTASFDSRGIEYNVRDNRERLDLKTKNIVTKFSNGMFLRPYQEEAARLALAENYCCIQLPTGAGKTNVAASIIKTYLESYYRRAVVYVVPTIRLQTEAKERFELYGIKTSTTKDFILGVANIVTYTTLVRSEISTEVKNRVGAILWDECHHLKANKASKIVHQYKKLNLCVGLSATVVADIEYKKQLNRFELYGIKTSTTKDFILGVANIVTYTTLVRSEISTEVKNRVGAILWDECHHLKANKASKIVHQYKKLNLCVGLSATVVADIEYKKQLNRLANQDFSVFGCTGLPVYYKPIDETIEEKYITPIKINVVENREQIKLTDEELADWHVIKRKVLMSKNRANLIAALTKQLVEQHNLNTVCLLIPEVLWSKQYMVILSQYFEFNKDVRIILMYGQDKYDEIIDGKIQNLATDEEKKEAMQAIKDPNIKTVFSATSFLYEGIDITNMQAIINVYGGRSTTRVKQQAGRVCRLFKDKNMAYIYEIYDDCPVLLSQLKARLKIYKSEYNAEVVDYKF